MPTSETMERNDYIIVELREDIAIIKERVVANDKIQTDRYTAQSAEIADIKQQVSNMDAKLDMVSNKVIQLESQNRVLKWVIGIVIAVAAVAVTWVRG